MNGLKTPILMSLIAQVPGDVDSFVEWGKFAVNGVALFWIAWYLKTQNEKLTRKNDILMRKLFTVVAPLVQSVRHFLSNAQMEKDIKVAMARGIHDEEELTKIAISARERVRRDIPDPQFDDIDDRKEDDEKA